MSEEATLDEASPEREESEETEQPELIQGVAWSTIKSVPEEWTVNNVESDIDILSGNNFSSEYFVEEGGIPLIRIRDLAEDDTTVNFDGEYDSRYLINQQDLLVGMDGEFEPHLWAGPQALLNQRVCKIEPKSEYNKIFFRYAIEKPLVYLQRSIAGTTVKHLSQSNINDLNLPTPPLPEQRKIATVLYTVDRAIEKNEQIREKAREVEEVSKTEFFTRGYSEWALDESVGWRCRANTFPKDWNIKTAEELMDITRGASPRPRSDDSLFGGGIPWIKIGDANRGISKRIEEVDSYVTEKGKQKSKFVEEDTLLVANSGATCGFSVFAGVDGCVHDGWLILRGYDDFAPDFLYHYINWNYDYLQSLSLGSAQTNLSTGLFGRLDIPIPPIQEQRQIVEALDSINRVASHASKEVDRLKQIKHGLMQDLLSGTARTTDTNIEVPEEIAQYG